jgi:hypothetical protein
MLKVSSIMFMILILPMIGIASGLLDIIEDINTSQQRFSRWTASSPIFREDLHAISEIIELHWADPVPTVELFIELNDRPGNDIS